MKRTFAVAFGAVSMAIALSGAAAQQRPSDFDILGVRMGMSPAEVAAKLRQADPAATIRTGKTAQLKTTGGTVFAEYVPRINLANEKTSHQADAFFFPRTGQNGLVQIQRSVRYPSGERLTIAAFVKLLEDKYGAPHYRGKYPDSPEFYWLFAEGGGPIQLPAVIRSFTKEDDIVTNCGILLGIKPLNIDSAGWWDYDNRERLANARQCSASIALYIRPLTDSGTVTAVNFTLTDVRKLGSASRVVDEADKAAQEQEAAQERERAKAAPKPKL